MRRTTMRPVFASVITLLLLLCFTIDASAAELSIMSFNVWGAEGTQAGRDRLLEIMQAGQADIIGVQELDSSTINEFATGLGYNSFQQSGGDIQIFSRFPIVGQSPAGFGAEIEFAPGYNIWVFNAHLPASPYEPYDLRDGTLAQNEAAVITAATNSRGAQVTSYLNDMSAAMASGAPVFLTGDFNEPSHLDWTQAAADATPRDYDLEVAWPTSTRFTDSGLIDSFRTNRPNELTDPGYTWTPGHPAPNVDANEVHDRIDIIYHSGLVNVTNAFTLGFDDTNINTDLAVPGYNSDHRSVVAEYDLPTADFLPGDVNLDSIVDEQDVTAFIDGWMTVLPADGITERWMKGDLNLNAQSDIGDIALFQNALSAAGLSFPGFGNSVPEPNTAILGCLLLIGLISARNRSRG